MSDLQEFEFEGHDVCSCLDLSDTSKALETLDSDEKGTKKVRTLPKESLNRLDSLKALTFKFLSLMIKNQIDLKSDLE